MAVNRIAERDTSEDVAVGVMAHNEAATIGDCLRAILDEPDSSVTFTSIVVVASACTDGTEDVVRQLAAEDSRLRLLSEDQRSGKAAAINWFLRETTEPTCVIVSADVIPARGSLTNLARPLLDPAVGMTGGRPVPTNRRGGIVGHAVHLLWQLHHRVALRSPKLGEAVAFRRMFDEIDVHSLVDEASIEGRVLAAGGSLKYIPTAVFRNHGPETIREYLQQRRRIHLGHLRLRAASGHAPSTLGLIPLLRAVGATLRRKPSAAPFLLATIMLETIARIQASAAFKFGNGHRDGTWAPISTSKLVVIPGHTLRAFHDGATELRLVPDEDASYLGRWMSRWHRAQVKATLRAEDHVRFESRSVRLRLVGDLDAAAKATARLRRDLSGWTVVTVQPMAEVIPVSMPHRT